MLQFRRLSMQSRFGITTLGSHRRYARAVLVDMEPKVINRAITSAANSGTSWCYSSGCSFSQQSGSGNNWARGYNSYGPKFADTICELVRREARSAYAQEEMFF